jgi:hypothetical protein
MQTIPSHSTYSSHFVTKFILSVVIVPLKKYDERTAQFAVNNELASIAKIHLTKSATTQTTMAIDLETTATSNSIKSLIQSEVYKATKEQTKQIASLKKQLSKNGLRGGLYQRLANKQKGSNVNHGQKSGCSSTQKRLQTCPPNWVQNLPESPMQTMLPPTANPNPAALEKARRTENQRREPLQNS